MVDLMVTVVLNTHPTRNGGGSPRSVRNDLVGDGSLVEIVNGFDNPTLSVDPENPAQEQDLQRSQLNTPDIVGWFTTLPPTNEY